MNIPAQLQRWSRSAAIVTAWAVSTAIALVLSNLALRALDNSSLSLWIPLVGSPFLLGLMQWLVLRWLLPKAYLWVIVTIIGGVLGWLSSAGAFFLGAYFVDLVGGSNLPSVPEIVFCGGLAGAGGLAIGFVQWVYLRRHLRRAAWWLLASAIAVGVGGGPNLCLGITLYSANNWPLWLAIGGLAGGSIKGGALVWLLRQPSSSQTEANAKST
ncbi:hypothetical protein [Synechococcus sp. PCC 7336]|uniref:hypothetical protein n=1 Tax=Synechococcus sp. PCC 7336 TaxID=195250 RepID=UPI0003455F65|nr:hypothetical protein [Synechococcus sp. PCC 7336]